MHECLFLLSKLLQDSYFKLLYKNKTHVINFWYFYLKNNLLPLLLLINNTLLFYYKDKNIFLLFAL